ncbi:MAG: Fur family transcriptional regulator [Symbiobacteriia bacterium]
MRPAASVADIRALFASRGLRTTAQRLAVYEYLQEHPTHPTAATIYDGLSRRYPMMSRATVYNTVDVLAQVGLVQRLDFGTGTHRYDGNPDFHVHLVCSGCGNIQDVEGGRALDAAAGKLAASAGFTVQDRRYELIGLCHRCVAKPASKKRTAATASN